MASFHTIIACGGTGGHLFPGIAVGEVLTARGHTVTLLISEKKIDSLASSGHPSLKFEKMPFLAMPRIYSPQMLPFLMGLWRGKKHCQQLIRNNQAQVVLGMGGFTSLAPLVAGRKEKARTLIHESNAIPGKANRLNARFCDVVLTGLQACNPYFKHKDIRTVGTPVRSSMRQKINLKEAYDFFKLNPKKKTLLVMGGSQGARGVNRAIAATLPQLDELGVQILHITGPAEYQTVRDEYAKHKQLNAQVLAFCHRMELAYTVADLAIARSGASSMTELAYFGLPSILVPYPHAADDHQTKNAEIFAKTGAALLITEDNLSPQVLASEVIKILDHKLPHHKKMKVAATKMAVRNSAEVIAAIIESLATEKAKA
jgi:UDP-N-acetylglucosamine--N-acetylmuramyl-(pentapeptide) pyrophosphoryl-undecaprenol N-acetylglucosamine transferase